MSDPKCYLCAKPGQFEKLFRNCKHESACFDCLRNCFVLEAKHVCKYPLECFHPECNLRLRNTQMERFVKSKEELQTYYELNAKATKRQDILEILREALGNIEICRCPKCQMLITKNGGCDHMICICGTEFNWGHVMIAETRAERRTRSVEVLPALCKKKKKKHPVLQVDEDFDCDSYSDPDESSADFPYEELETETKESTPNANLITIDLGKNVVPLDLHSFPSISLEEDAVVSVASSAISAGIETEWEQDFEVLELTSDQSDESWTESWTQFENDTESGSSSMVSSMVTTTDGFQTPSSETTWEELSEVSSVVSFHSKTGMSFLEATRAASASTQPNSISHANNNNNNKWKAVARVPKPMSHLNTIAEHNSKSVVSVVPSDDDSEGDMFNADFMFEGAKGSRGGKQKFMFKHQPKRKYRRSDRRLR